MGEGRTSQQWEQVVEAINLIAIRKQGEEGITFKGMPPSYLLPPTRFHLLVSRTSLIVLGDQAFNM
jgi:hypothetical protein